MTMPSDKDDGGNAFPVGGGDQRNAGMTLRDYFACRAPEPTKDDVESIMRREQMANPHNDHYKPVRRGRTEIVCSLRYEWADAMLKARK